MVQGEMLSNEKIWRPTCGYTSYSLKRVNVVWQEYLWLCYPGKKHEISLLPSVGRQIGRTRSVAFCKLSDFCNFIKALKSLERIQLKQIASLRYVYFKIRTNVMMIFFESFMEINFFYHNSLFKTVFRRPVMLAHNSCPLKNIYSSH